jgi:hypothetical protein
MLTIEQDFLEVTYFTWIILHNYFVSMILFETDMHTHFEKYHKTENFQQDFFVAASELGMYREPVYRFRPRKMAIFYIKKNHKNTLLQGNAVLTLDPRFFLQTTPWIPLFTG